MKSCTDITRQKRTEQALRESEHIYHLTIDAIQQIRTHQNYYHRPHIIALTAHVLDEQHRQSLNSDMDDMDDNIQKPIQVTGLTKALETFALR